MKRIIAAALIIFVLTCMVTVSASNAGSTGDPLITLSYLRGTYTESLRADVSTALGNAADKAMSRLDEIYRNYIGYNFAPKFTHISLASGDSVRLTTGGSFILLSGTATLTISSGNVINVSTGNEVTSAVQLALNQRYFCAENTTVLITASAAATGQVDGFYLTDGTATPVPQLPFTDVRATDWFYSAVDFVYKNNLFQGTSANAFSPGVSMTRGMFVTVLHRLDGLPSAGAGGGFSDVSDRTLYYYNAVTWANENKIVEGYADGTFRPDASVTREQMATIMHRYAIYKGRDMTASETAYNAFPDRNSVSDYAVSPLQWAVSWGVITGSDGRLLPQSTATRAQVAQIIFNYCEKIGR